MEIEESTPKVMDNEQTNVLQMETTTILGAH